MISPGENQPQRRPDLHPLLLGVVVTLVWVKYLAKEYQKMQQSQRADLEALQRNPFSRRFFGLHR